MKLVIIESPNKIKKLRSILPSDYEIVASVGHMFDLPKKDLGIDLDTFDIDLILDESKKDILANIKKYSDQSDAIYIASDADREGEAVGFNIYTSLSKKNQKKCQRLLINAITKEAVEAAIKNPTTIDLNLCDAQKGRRVTDRLVGYKVSPIMWTKGLKGTSAGRVQSVALKYISDLEKEINSFKSEEYWKGFLKTADFSAELSAINGKSFEIKNEEQAKKIKADISSGIETAVVTDYAKKVRTRSPEPPFITSTIQQAASNVFGWNAQKTMQVAQSLFAAGQITYLRSDSLRIEPDKIASIRSKIESSLGQNYLHSAPRVYANKDASQDAHEAIRPTYDKAIAPLSPDEKKLLDLVDRRFKASQMADAIFDQASIKIEIKSAKNLYTFKISGSVLTFDGFLKVYGDNKEDLNLPVMNVGDKVSVTEIQTTKHFTQAPGRYSDASLIKKLEKEGVGRPSTYASIIETLMNRGYAERDKKAIRATELGIMVSDYLSLAFPLIVSSEMTAKMEEDLDKIAGGTGNYKEIMQNFYSALKESIDAAKQVNAADIFKTEKTCPECNLHLVKKKSEYGIFLGCSGWPKCGYILKTDDNGNEVAEKEATGEPCPSCNNGMISLKKSKFGPFKGCTNYPACKHIVKVGKDGKDVVKKKVEDSQYDCPKCNVKLLKRQSKYGEWHTCRNYPKCKYNYSPKKKGDANKEE